MVLAVLVSATVISCEELRSAGSTVSGKGRKEAIKSSSSPLQTENSDNRPERIFL